MPRVNKVLDVSASLAEAAIYQTKQSAKRLLLAGLAILCCLPIMTTATSPRQLVEVADLAGPVISPDGRSVVFRLEQASVERNTYDSFWYVQSVEGEAPPRRVADGGVPMRDSAGVSLPPAVIWSPDGNWIYYRARIDDRVDVWRAAPDGSGAAPATHDTADVRDFRLSADGSTLYYSVGPTRKEVVDAERTEYDRGVRIDSSVPISQGLYRSGYTEGRLATQRYFAVWGRRSLLGDLPDRWKAVDLRTQETKSLAPSFRLPDEPAESGLANDQGLAWKSESESTGGRIALLNRTGEAKGLLHRPDIELSVVFPNRSRRSIRCEADSCTGKAISRIQWRPASDEVLFAVTDPLEGLAQSIYAWNIQSSEVRLVVRTQGLVSGGRDPGSNCAVSTDMLVCVVAYAERPPRLERIDLDTGVRRQLYDPNTALALDITAAVSVRLLRWSDDAGQEFTGQLFTALGVGGAPAPLFVTYYTCPGFLRGGLGDEWPLASLATRGIAALCINNPPGYNLDATKRYARGLSAVESIVRLLSESGEVDANAVGMGGLSYGSEVTLWTAIHSKILAAASITSPSIEPNYYLYNSLRGDYFFDPLKKQWGLGSPEDTPEQWRVISPAFQTDRITAPILLQMPEQEYLYALGFAFPLMREHRADLYVFPHEPHQKHQPRHKLAAYERNLDWFRFWLQGQEDMDPAKRSQYDHWRQMKAKALERTAMAEIEVDS